MYVFSLFLRKKKKKEGGTMQQQLFFLIKRMYITSNGAEWSCWSAGYKGKGRRIFFSSSSYAEQQQRQAPESPISRRVRPQMTFFSKKKMVRWAASHLIHFSAFE